MLNNTDLNLHWRVGAEGHCPVLEGWGSLGQNKVVGVGGDCMAKMPVLVLESPVPYGGGSCLTVGGKSCHLRVQAFHVSLTLKEVGNSSVRVASVNNISAHVAFFLDHSC